jgi:hypothetical protein
MARDVVVCLARIKFGADARLKFLHPERGRCTGANDVARGRQVLKGRERIADHGGDIQRSCGLIEGPERFGTVGIEFVELVQLGVGELGEGDHGTIERSQECQRLESSRFQPSAEVRWQA